MAGRCRPQAGEDLKQRRLTYAGSPAHRENEAVPCAHRQASDDRPTAYPDRQIADFDPRLQLSALIPHRANTACSSSRKMELCTHPKPPIISIYAYIFSISKFRLNS